MPRTPAPAPAITGDVIRIVPLIIADGEENLWSLDYMSNGFATGLANDAAVVLGQFLTNYATGIKGLLAADCMFNGAWVYVLSRLDVASFFSTIGNGVGTVAGNHLDKQLAARLQKQTTLKGAHGRGAAMFGPLSTTFVTPSIDANHLNVAALTAFTAFCNLIITPIVAAGGSGNTFSPCVSTRPVTGTSLTTHAQPLSKIVPSSIVGTVRRRRIGRGV